MWLGTTTAVPDSYQVIIPLIPKKHYLLFIFRCNPVVEKKCTKIEEEECKPITRQVCTTLEKKAEPVCQEVETTVPKEVCETRNVTNCQPIMREVCDVEIRQRCESIAEEVPFEVFDMICISYRIVNRNYFWCITELSNGA